MLKRLSVALLFLASMVSCAGGPAKDHRRAEGWGPLEGLSSPARPELASTSRQSASATPKKRWEHADQLEKLRQVGGRGTTDHLSPGLERTVWTNDKASTYSALSSESPLPTGALIVQRHHLPDNANTSHIFVMHKKNSPALQPQAGWSYAVLTSDAMVVRQGRLPRCHRCHAESRHDHLFGPPR